MASSAFVRLVAVAAFGGLALAGCASSTPAATSTAAQSSDQSVAASIPAAGSGSTASGAVLGVADSSLGQIVVDGKGMTVYMYDKDSQNSGKSACPGACAHAWPAVNTDSSTPTVTGVTGKVGTITGVDGKTQVTLNGWPLYYYANDAKAGDVTGQGVGGVWWVLNAAGAKVTTAAAGGGGY